MLCFSHELFVWRRLKWVSVHIARSSAYMVSTTFPFTAVTDSGASFSIRYETVSTRVETLTFLMEAKARLSSVQVSGVLTARLSSGTGCVKVASISRRNCCLSAGRLGVTGLGESFRESVRFALGRRYFVLPCCRSESGTTHCCFILLTFFHTDPKSAFPAEIESAKAIQ